MKNRTLSLILTLLLTIGAAVPAFAATSPSSDTLWRNGRNYNVLVINFDPIFTTKDGKVHQHDLVDWWNDPHWLADEFGKDLKEVSHGYLNYKVVDWIDLDEMPKTVDGKQYTKDAYYSMLQESIAATDGAYWSYSGWEDWGFSFDYDYYMKKFDVYNKVNKGQVDEVWIFAGPCIGTTLYESHMMGKGAFWCNSPGEEKDTDLFVVYGFNFERGVGEMLEDAGHRAESILSEVFGSPDYTKDYNDFTDWEKFTVYDQLKPGKAGVGNVHFSPNSVHDYDWGNKTYVQSNCNDWKNYPNLTGKSEKVNCSLWGDGDIRLHHKWWFDLFPHTTGISDKTGKYNNWWIYFSLDFWNETYYQENPTTAPTTFSGKIQLTGKHVTSGISGQIIGAGGLWTDGANGWAEAWDGNGNTFYDPSVPGPDDWTGILSDQATVVTEVRVLPRIDFFDRTAGAYVQGSNDGKNWTTLAHFTRSDCLTDGATQKEIVKKVNNPSAFWMFRYVNDGTSHGDVADVKIVGTKGDAILTYPGQVIGKVLSTDIRAYINGAEIPAYNVDGKLAVIVSDLNNYGFKTKYDNGARKTTVTRDKSASTFTSAPSKASGQPIGTALMNVLSSDIIVELDGKQVPAFNVDNRMAIPFSELKEYGEYKYDNGTRTSSITLK